MDRIREFFANMTRNQKIGMGVIGGLIVVAVAGIAIAAGGGDDEVETVASTTSSSTTTTAPPAVAPLTGLPQPDAALRNRPALVVKIDNDNAKARPQAGLNQADVVVEEAVEGGVTRFAAIFQSTDSDPVGPTRSARTTDVQIIANLKRPLFAWSGANPGVAATIRSSPLVDLGFDSAPDAYYRDSGYTAPSNLFSNTSELFGLAPQGSQPPPPLFAYRGKGDKLPASARDVAAVRVSFGGKVNYTSEWRWDAAAKGWKRNQLGTPHIDTKAQQIAPANVVLQFTQYKDSGYVDVTGEPSPEAEMTGSGKVWILSNGKLVEGEWSRPNADAVTKYTDAQGKEIGLTPGRTWLVLARPDGAEVAD
jgi:hypothetical protein